jgi:hypothetical protein
MAKNDVKKPQSAVAKRKQSPGRPTAYNERYNQLAFRYCLLGATDADLAGFFEVSEVTLNAWKKKHPNFLKSLKAGKDEADAKVAAAMYNRALGYSHPEDKIFCGKDGEITVVPTTKHYPPDHGSCMSWLKNRQPARFRDKQEIDLGLTDDMKDFMKEIGGNGTKLPINS